MDLDQFEERSAIMEFDGGMSRFEAETRAAQAQGYQRHEVMNAIRERDFARGGDHSSEVDRGQRADNVSAMQRDTAQEDRPVSERNPQGRRDRGVLLALRMEHGGIL